MLPHQQIEHGIVALEQDRILSEKKLGRFPKRNNDKDKKKTEETIKHKKEKREDKKD